ncbi:MAG: GxxExxY protein [Phycisphaerales bacterium]|nr:GxxExxY protein [Phycisphaerales bacterium]
MLVDEALTERIIGAAVKVHKALGPGLLESVYEVCLAYELSRGGLGVERQLDVPVVYEGVRLDTGFRADLVVERKVVVELKAVDKIVPIQEAQLLTHLRLTGVKVGLLMNFNQLRVTDNLIRRVL